MFLFLYKLCFLTFNEKSIILMSKKLLLTGTKYFSEHLCIKKVFIMILLETFLYNT